MIFQVDEKEIDARVQSGEPTISQHTGKPLQRLSMTFIVTGEVYNAEALELTETAKSKGMSSVAQDGTVSTWKVGNTTWSYNDNQGPRTIYHHTWNIEEQESLNLEKLVIDDLELEPYKYNERFDQGALIMRARIRQSKDDREAFTAHFKDKQYFPVVRVGISDAVMEMRFGASLWSEEGDMLKREIILVERAYDSQKQRLRILEPQIPNMQQMLATTVSVVGELWTLLIDKGILTQQDVDALKQSANNRVHLAYRQFYKVGDLDQWLDDEE